MASPTPQPGIMDIALYQGGASHIDGVSNVLKLSSNENPSGPPQSARDAITQTVQDLHRYPSTDHGQLRAAIGDVHGLDPDRIICGVGSDEIITFLCQAYAGVGDEVIYTEHGFGMYKISAKAAGATPVMVKERNRTVSATAILKAVTDKTKIIFIANPANPTGTMVGRARIRDLIRDLPDHVMLVLDGAYAEFVEDFDGGAEFATKHENVFMTRTFSKLYGLGGLRVGWGYGAQSVIDVLNRIRGPFNLSGPALAGALAAIQDRKFADAARADNAKWRAWLANALAEIGVPSDVSNTNFILARFADQAEAESCDDFLKTKGVIVRRVGGYGLPYCLRITVGDEAGCRRVAHVIRQFKEGAA